MPTLLITYIFQLWTNNFSQVIGSLCWFIISLSIIQTERWVQQCTNWLGTYWVYNSGPIFLQWGPVMKAGKRNYLFQRPPEREKCKIGLKSSHIPHASFKTSWKHGRLYFPATTTLLAEVRNAAIHLQSDELPSSQSFRSKMSNWQKIQATTFSTW